MAIASNLSQTLGPTKPQAPEGCRYEKMWQFGLIKSPENILTIWRPVLPVFPRAQSASRLISTLNSFPGVSKGAEHLGLHCTGDPSNFPGLRNNSCCLTKMQTRFGSSRMVTGPLKSSHSSLSLKPLTLEFLIYLDFKAHVMCPACPLWILWSRLLALKKLVLFKKHIGLSRALDPPYGSVISMFSGFIDGHSRSCSGNIWCPLSWLSWPLIREDLFTFSQNQWVLLQPPV